MKKKDNESKHVSEPETGYENRIVITSFDELEERSREFTRNLSHEQRMEYLQKLISITQGTDMREQIRIFNEGRIIINKSE